MNEDALCLLEILSRMEDDDSVTGADLEFASALLQSVQHTADSAEEIIGRLKEGGYVERAGASGNDGASIPVTERGKALAAGAASATLGEAHVRRIEDTIQRYGKTSDTAGQRLVEELRDRANQRAQEGLGRIQQVDGSAAVANCGVLEVTFTQDHIYVLEFDVPSLRGRGKRAQYRAFEEAITSAERSLGALLPFWNDGDGAFCVCSPKEDLWLEIEGERFPPSGSRQTRTEDMPGRLDLTLKDAVTKRFVEMGWTDAGYGKVVDLRARERQETQVGLTHEYPQLQMWIDEVDGNQFLLWLDEDRRVTVPVTSLIETWKEEGLDDQTIRKELEELTLHALPRTRDASFVDIEFGVDMTDEAPFEGASSYSDYWKQAYGLDLIPHQPVVTIQTKRELRYPAQAVYAEKNSMERRVGSWGNRTPRAMAPEERAQGIRDVLEQLFGPARALTMTPFKIEVIERLPTWAKLRELGFCQGTATMESPTMEFGQGQKSKNATMLFEAGPVSGRKEIVLSPAIVPKGTDHELVKAALEELSATLGETGLASATVPSDLQIMEYDPADPSRIKRLVRGAEAHDVDFQVALGLFPSGSRVYYELKRAFQKRDRIQVQGLQTSTLGKLVDGPPGVAEGLAIKVYCKACDQGDALWTLEHPSDGAGSTLYLGVGYSYDLHGTETQAKCAAALCDPHGRDLRIEQFPPDQAPRKIERGWFQRVLAKIREKLEARTTERLVIYRLGNTYEDEIEAMETALANLNLEDPPELVIVEVDESFRRVLGDGHRKENPPAGYTTITREDEAVLALTEPTQGTVQPLRLVRKTGSTPIRDLAREYFDQTHLVWTSPGIPTKNVLVQKVADKAARYATVIPGEEPLDHLTL